VLSFCRSAPATLLNIKSARLSFLFGAGSVLRCMKNSDVAAAHFPEAVIRTHARPSRRHWRIIISIR
jgi:hypothetical protein